MNITAQNLLDQLQTCRVGFDPLAEAGSGDSQAEKVFFVPQSVMERVRSMVQRSGDGAR